MDNIGQLIWKHTVHNPGSRCEKYRDPELWARCIIKVDGSISVRLTKREPKQVVLKKGETEVIMSPGKGQGRKGK